MTSATDPFVTSDLVTISADDAVDAASGFIRELCGWHIWPQITTTKQLRGAGGNLLVLPTLMLDSVTSITVNGTDLDPSSVTAWEHGVLERTGDCSWPNWSWEGASPGRPGWPTWGTVTVEFVHGYETVPPTIRAVCQSLAKRWPLSATPWTTRKMGSASISIAKGIGTSSPLGDLTVIEQMIVDRFTVKNQP